MKALFWICLLSVSASSNFIRLYQVYAAPVDYGGFNRKWPKNSNINILKIYLISTLKAAVLYPSPDEPTTHQTTEKTTIATTIATTVVNKLEAYLRTYSPNSANSIVFSEKYKFISMSFMVCFLLRKFNQF